MHRKPVHKYRATTPVNLVDRQWPSRAIERAPVWCSVDLRDGNQALPEPMNGERKLHLFQLLVTLGFKQIEVGFPSASQTDFDFVRHLIEHDLVPPDVTIQVLTQAREPLIRRTFEAIEGARRVIVHLYNSTSPLQRRVVFDLPRQGIVDIAVRGTRLVKTLAAALCDTEVWLEYSPESFSETELDFAVEISSAVLDAWEPTASTQLILNLPATVEVATPNVYADQIEWFARNMKSRADYQISLHPHNDRGTAVAAAELALMAGADRVEGTLLGNGERTGNVDIMVLALNMYTQGVDPQLDFHDLPHVRRVLEYCNRIPTHCRHPYAGELVFTAFSGSHQDAIRKGLAAREQQQNDAWDVPYLAIDPADIGREYETVIRINSQSGKGGIAYVMDRDFGFVLPRDLQLEFSKIIQRITDEQGGEISSAQLRGIFEREYLPKTDEPTSVPVAIHLEATEDGRQRLFVHVGGKGVRRELGGTERAPLDELVGALGEELGLDCEVTDYTHHSTGAGSRVRALAYVRASVRGAGSGYGVGRHDNPHAAAAWALLAAVNRILRRRPRESVAMASIADASASVGF